MKWLIPLLILLSTGISHAGIVRIEVDRSVNDGTTTVTQTSVLTGVCVRKAGLGRYWVATAGHAFSAQDLAIRVHGYPGRLLKKSETAYEDLAVVEVQVESDNWDVNPLGRDPRRNQPVEFVGYADGSAIGKPVLTTGQMRHREIVDVQCRHGHSGAPLFLRGSSSVSGIVMGFDNQTLETVVTPVSRLQKLLDELKE